MLLSIRGIVTVLVLAALFTLAVIWISRHDGWEGKGCGGNCSACHERCNHPEKKNQRMQGSRRFARGAFFHRFMTSCLPHRAPNRAA